MKKLEIAILYIICLLIAIGCEKEEVITDTEVEKRGDRTIGYDILDINETGDFEMNYDIASSQLKSEFIQLLQPWNAFENNNQGIYDGEAIQLFEILNDFALSSGTELSLIITPIDIPGRFLPSYLENKKLNDPDVISGFNDLIDRLFNPTDGVINPEIVTALSVGNEIDHYNWSANNDQPSEYKEFLQAIKPKINSYGIPLHFTGTLYGLDAAASTWVDIVNAVDKLSITYYPLNSDFTVKSPDVVHSDFDSFFLKYSGKQIFVQEVGYPSASGLNSSENKQAEFFCEFFKVWDNYKDQISHVSILRLNDVSLASAQSTAVTYGLPGNENFIEYIRTLGIRTWENTGTNKESFNAIINELERREW